MAEAALERVYETPSLALAGDTYAAAAAGVLAAIGDQADGPSLAAGDDPAEVLEDLVERWALTYSANTGAAYRASLGEWLAYCRGRGADPLTVGAGVVRAYQADLEVSDLAPSTVRAKLAAVRSFYRFVVDERARLDDPAAGTTRRMPATLAATLAVRGQDRTVAQLAAGYLLAHKGNTRRAYETSLRTWLTWCSEIGLDPLEARRPHVDAFRAVLDENYQPSTVNRHLSVIRGFYRYCVEEEALGRNPAAATKSHKLPRHGTTATGLDRDEARAVLRAARTHSPMSHALFTLLVLNGLRISEALGTDVEDLTTARGHRVLMVRRKGYQGSQQAVPLSPRTAEVLDAWLAVRPRLLADGVGDAEHGPLFVNAEGHRMSRASAWSRLRSMAKLAVPHKAATLHPHDLRHAFVTLSLDAGVPLRDVQDSAGHESADTTRRYDRGRNNLDRNATYALTSYLAEGA